MCLNVTDSVKGHLLAFETVSIPVSSTGDHNAHLSLHGTAGDGLADDGTTLEEGEASPDAQPQQVRRMRREACTCPYCKDNDGR